jgi:phospholipid/cholesterol/gamma-HCH transport system substrate-binding protein
MIDSLRTVAQSAIFRIGLSLVVLAAVAVVAIEVTSGPSTYPLKAVYSSAPGLFPGASVDVLGVKVGTVDSVKNVGNTVAVGFSVDQGTRIPAKAIASLVAPQLLGEPDVDLNPGYTGGPMLTAGSIIPLSRTTVPISTDEVLKQVQRTLDAINPHAVGNLVSNLAQDLDGQGASLNKLIKNAAGTIQLLANKGNDLGQLNGTLAQLTGTLDDDTSQIEHLVTEYDTVSGVLAQHSGQLNDALTQLTGASSALVGVLTPNLLPLEADIGTVTTVGRTLDRNLGSVDQILQQGNSLFQGAARAYDPNYNWLDLNIAAAPGVTGAYVSGLLRDRLAGICRRIVSNHSTGLTSAELSTLNLCGNPASGFFDGLLNQIPTILNTLTTGTASDTGSALLQTGLKQIVNIEAGSGGTANSNPSAPNPPSTSTTTPTTVPTTTPSNAATCNLLTELLGCKPSSTSSNSSSSVLGGLLSNTVSGSKNTPTASIVSNKVSTLTLTAPASKLLPPMPGAHHAHAHHRGVLTQWMHDVRSWL